MFFFALTTRIIGHYRPTNVSLPAWDRTLDIAVSGDRCGDRQAHDTHPDDGELFADADTLPAQCGSSDLVN